MLRFLFAIASAAALSSDPFRRRKRRSGITTPKRPPASAPPASEEFVASVLAAAQESNEAAFAPLAVPERCRSAEAGDWFRFVGLDDLFPGAGLGEIFDESAEFREALRNAARKDCCDATPEVIRYDLTSSSQGAWKKPVCAATTEVLRKALGSNAPTGEDFYATIGALDLNGVRPRTGHFIEIVGGPGARRRARYAWHQDRGGDDAAVTIMMGFPAVSKQRGCGVFSHVAPLAHRVRNDEDEGDHSRPREFSDPYGDQRFLDVERVPEASVVRPSYGRGRELLVYSDARTIHSSPDVVYRDCLWRFM